MSITVVVLVDRLIDLTVTVVVDAVEIRTGGTVPDPGIQGLIDLRQNRRQIKSKVLVLRFAVDQAGEIV